MPDNVLHRLPQDQNAQNAQEVKDAYAVLRESNDVVRVAFPFGSDGWMTTTYEGAREFYNDPRFSKEPMLTLDDYPRVRQTEVGASPSFMLYDSEKHQSKRRAIMKYLTVKRYRQCGPKLRRSSRSHSMSSSVKVALLICMRRSDALSR